MILLVGLFGEILCNGIIIMLYYIFLLNYTYILYIHYVTLLLHVQFIDL